MFTSQILYGCCGGAYFSALGIILLIVRLFDAVTDPAIGLISRTVLKTPFGRRRPLIVAGSLLTTIAILLLFNPPIMNAGDNDLVHVLILLFCPGPWSLSPMKH
ncbi:MAG: MFS transporter [Desulfobacterales bacterium]